MKITRSAIGTLMKNTARHEICSINQPPITGPTAVVIALKPDHVPIARPRSFCGNELLMIARLPGTRSAAPSPCAARAEISWAVVGARPHHADANANRSEEHTSELQSLTNLVCRLLL